MLANGTKSSAMDKNGNLTSIDLKRATVVMVRMVHGMLTPDEAAGIARYVLNEWE